ncbi:ribosome small subunit-dependent GTPase A [Petrocella sp. FN5]|uniref:ribosome small subunit-dependent GTPase A n=1 Tax=Petrocella sp. FN5 TaxID=3032002 RepID=UPI0023DBFE71|nr:ribosome small subunit-dependent GTPase A [Petrocella sp. FN5]MDF1616411.1 ribosome small subunit-dependent GTPase A [Petrocella sp. FN5]
MIGKIVKGIAGFYYVHVPHMGIFECKARGIFRKENIKPLIGDNVEIVVLDEENKKGNIETIQKRKNQLDRPMVANIDQAVIVFAVAYPEPNYNLLDRFLVMVEEKGIEAIICFNKTDILTKEQVEMIKAIYEKTGYKVFATSSIEERGIDSLKDALYDKTTVFAGPSGVGKSSILNLIQSEILLETGIVSEKIGRGKHTTRHADLICFHENSYVVDTPGFSSLDIDHLSEEDIKLYFKEFYKYEPYCKFKGCNHLNEPVCGIKDAVKEGDISHSRYTSYKQLIDELKDIRRW